MAELPDTAATRGMIAKVKHLVRVVESDRSNVVPPGPLPAAEPREQEPAMKLHELADRPGARKKRHRIGRGIGSGCGKTGGRGGKGQTARSGVRIKGFEGGQMPLHRRLPKRGFKNTSFARKLNEINLGRVQAAIDAGKLDAGATVDAEALVKAGVLRRARDGVRLLGSGEIKAKVAFSVWGASKSAVAAVEKAGGSVTILAPKARERRTGRLTPIGNGRPIPI